jgi:hypothetical protein
LALCTAILAAALPAPSAAAATQTFTSVADAYVSQGNPSANYGGKPKLRARKSSPAQTGYLRFDLKGLSDPVTQATLRLYATSGSKGGYDVRDVDDDAWGEKSITYSNAPSTGQTVGSSGSFKSGKWVSVDVTSLVSGNGDVNFALTASSSDTITLASREYGAKFAPQLVVETGSAPPGDTTPPSAPANLAATGGDGSVALSWSASSDDVGVSAYEVYRANPDGSWPTDPIATTAPDTRTYTDTGLTNGTTYTYRVAARDSAGNLSAPSDSDSAIPRAGPCGTRPSPPGAWQHVVWIVMENKPYADIIGASTAAPYTNSLAAQCGLATKYTAITHPSLPNYIAMTSGSPQGVSDDGPPSAHPLSVPSLFSQLGEGGWRSLEESMPSNCAQISSGDYAVKHNPAAYYTNLASQCSLYDVPLGATPDLSAKFTFVTPNLCNDTHDCSIATGDEWLKGFIAKLTASPEYRAGATAIFLTWDEDDYSEQNHIPTLVISPATPPGTQSDSAFDHYSLLRTTEEMLGLDSFLGGAADAASMRSAFHL